MFGRDFGRPGKVRVIQGGSKLMVGHYRVVEMVLDGRFDVKSRHLHNGGYDLRGFRCWHGRVDLPRQVFKVLLDGGGQCLPVAQVVFELHPPENVSPQFVELWVGRAICLQITRSDVGGRCRCGLGCLSGHSSLYSIEALHK